MKYGLEVGDHAIAEQIVPCWECHYCQSGHYNLCELACLTSLLSLGDLFSQVFLTMCLDGDRGLKVGCHGDYQYVTPSTHLRAGGMAVYMLYPRGSIVHKVSLTPTQ